MSINSQKRKDALRVIRDIRRTQKKLAATTLDAESFEQLNGSTHAVEELLGKTIMFSVLNEQEVLDLRRELNDALAKELDTAVDQLKASTEAMIADACHEVNDDITVKSKKVEDISVDDVIAIRELEKTASMCEELAKFYAQFVEPAASTIVTDDDKTGDGEDTEYTGDQPDEDGDDPEKGDGNEPDEGDGDDDTEKIEDPDAEPGVDKALSNAVNDLGPAESVSYLHGAVKQGDWTSENWKPTVEAYSSSVKTLKDAIDRSRELLDVSTFTEYDYRCCNTTMLNALAKLGTVTDSVIARVNACNKFIADVNKS